MMLQEHAIQLQGIRVLELGLNVFDVEKAQSPDLNLPFSFGVGVTEFDEENRVIGVGVKGTIGNDGSEDGEDSRSPFVVKAHILGQFVIDTDNFPLKHISEWAQKNAPLILLPFLREHIYGLASRAGIREVVVPLYTLPVYKVDKQPSLTSSKKDE
ncbi:protein-export chaperone SecB [Burkholderia vietnamiensis]|uniref:protein-export chaperone SecB n=1 Tax=Burkholderia vietnamiensis TaxID=60552 RepID=UPI001B9F8044|nr:protein-export chaperone SecB [Burkholderia vietnamiensis]MBR8085286.1 protein-export chaperone SecB [Burkholderia vietnamiensis]